MPDLSPLCPSRAEFRVAQLAVTDDLITITAVARRAAVRCPACGTRTTRVHSRCVHTLADLPWQGVRVRLRATVRRFFCDLPRCPRRIFAEPVPETAARYARRTARAATLLEVLGFTVGGRTGARLATRVGLGCAPGTVLAQVRAAVDAEGPAPRVLGLDDWAYRRGQRYGTLLVDLERHRVVDLLPDGEVATFAAWLRAHPGVELISRDRAGAYADGTTQGMPNAIQIADRFRLLQNLTGAIERALERHHRTVRTPVPPLTEPAPTPAKRGGPVAQRASHPRRPDRLKTAARERRRAKYDEVVALHARHLSKLAISRRVGVSRATILRWLGAGTFPERRAGPRRAATLTPHAAYFHQRWAEGCHNATQLWRELRDAHDFRGGLSTVRDWVYLYLRGRAPRTPAAAEPRTAHPAPRRAAWLFTTTADALTSPEMAYVNAVCAACPALATVRTLAADFRRMLMAHAPNALGAWLAAAQAGGLRCLATRLERDRDAVLAAILFRWSNGQVEGQVNRLKLVKRSMYGRASFPLLRRRVLAA